MDKCSIGIALTQKGDKFSFMQYLKNDMMKAIPYVSIVGSLMYVQAYTRLDISFVVNMLG